tara:strand:- start:3750 stop:4199 length:450 start_codon:yes stop_codon:yes gene_type:complete
MKNWNRTGKIKALLILFISLLSLRNISNKNEIIESENYVYVTLGIFLLIFTALFLPLMTKLLSLFKVKFKKPDWNRNPISIYILSNSLITFQFIGYWLLLSGFSQIIITAIVNQNFRGEAVLQILYGFGILFGIKLSVLWLKLNSNNIQ